MRAATIGNITASRPGLMGQLHQWLKQLKAQRAAQSRIVAAGENEAELESGEAPAWGVIRSLMRDPGSEQDWARAVFGLRMRVF